MRIVCPQCGYSRDIPEDKIPARSSIASCPKCSFRFRFRGYQAPPEREDSLGEPVYPPRPSRPVREPEPVAPAPFEARSQRLYVSEGESGHYGHVPPRPQARWLPDPEPEPAVAAPSFPQPPYADPAGTGVPGPDPFGQDNPDSAPQRRPYRAQPVPMSSFEPGGAVSYSPQAHGAEPLSPGKGPDPRAPREREEPAAHEHLAHEHLGHEHLGHEHLGHEHLAQEPAHAEHELQAPVQHAQAPEIQAPEERASVVFEPGPDPEPVSTQHREWNLPPTAPRPEPEAPSPATSLAEEAGGVQQAQGQAGEDSVRDIWARLQAMGAKPAATAAPGAPRQAAQSQPGEPRPAAPPVSGTLAPWEQLEHFGVIPAFTLTVKNILSNPGDFFEQLPSTPGKVRPLVFAVAVCMVTVLFGLVWNFFGMGPNLAELGRTEWFQGLGAGALGRLAWLGLAPILVTAFVFLDSALAHLLLGLLRSASKPYDDTFRTICYAGGPWLLAALPVPFSYLIPIVLIWHMTLQAIGLKKLHGAGYPQVLAAVLVKWSMYFMASFAVLHLLLTRR